MPVRPLRPAATLARAGVKVGREVRHSVAVPELRTAGFAQVFAEVEWWDGPPFGLVNIDGRAHYFHWV
jgi:hypothetical protein